METLNSMMTTQRQRAASFCQNVLCIWMSQVLLTEPNQMIQTIQLLECHQLIYFIRELFRFGKFVCAAIMHNNVPFKWHTYYTYCFDLFMQFSVSCISCSSHNMKRAKKKKQHKMRKDEFSCICAHFRRFFFCWTFFLLSHPISLSLSLVSIVARKIRTIFMAW